MSLNLAKCKYNKVAVRLITEILLKNIAISSNFSFFLSFFIQKTITIYFFSSCWHTFVNFKCCFSCQHWLTATSICVGLQDQANPTPVSFFFSRLSVTNFLTRCKKARFLKYFSWRWPPAGAMCRNTTVFLSPPPQESQVGWNSILTITAAAAVLLMMTSLLRALVRCWLMGLPLQWRLLTGPSNSPRHRPQTEAEFTRLSWQAMWWKMDGE